MTQLNHSHSVKMMIQSKDSENLPIYYCIEINSLLWTCRLVRRRFIIREQVFVAFAADD